MEIGRRPSTVRALNRAAFALHSSVSAYLEQITVTDLPRDAVHLRSQELVIGTAKSGRWRSLPEAQLDRESRTSRWVDVLLERRHTDAPTEYCVCEIWDWLADVGDATRDFTRRLEALDRLGVARMRGDEQVPKTCGLWLLRGTRRNRELVAGHRNFFQARFPGSGRAWLAALHDAAAPMPTEPALLWVSVGGDRHFESRLG